jgi:hypothetical protein
MNLLRKMMMKRRRIKRRRKRKKRNQTWFTKTILLEKDFLQWQRPRQVVRVLWLRNRNLSSIKPRLKFRLWKLTLRLLSHLLTGTISV